MIPALSAFLIALISTLVLTPLAKRAAPRLGLLDNPDARRKLQTKAIPLVGGLTVFAGAFVAIVLVLGQGVQPVDGETTARGNLVGLLIAAVVLLLVGLIDDRFGLRGRQKLIGQIIVATILIIAGYSFDHMTLFGDQKVSVGQFTVLVMYAWIIGCINSVNLLDGADGFATSLGILMSGAICLMALLSGEIESAMVAAAMCGALLGFLRYNFPPASAYLGDSGSMLIGMMVAALAIRSTAKQQTAYAFFAPLALLAIPMFDTMVAIVRRRLTGKSVYDTDRGHLHHVLMRKGLGPRLALIWFIVLCLTTVSGALLAYVFKQSEYAIVSMLAVVIFLVGGRIFGFKEFQLVSDKATRMGKSFLVTNKDKTPQRRNLSIQMQGNRNWNLIWEGVSEFAEFHDLDEVTLDLDLPWLHENFHATYRDAGKRERSQSWLAELPIQSDERIIGRLILQGNAERVLPHDVLPVLMEAVEDLQPYFQDAIEQRTDSAQQPRLGRHTKWAARNDLAPTAEDAATRQQVSDDSTVLDVG